MNQAPDPYRVNLEKGESVIAENLDPLGGGRVAHKDVNSLYDKIKSLFRNDQAG